MNENFEKWSKNFKVARDDIGNVPRIVELCKTRIPGEWQCLDWQDELGFRKSGLDRGEKLIERKLLGEIEKLRLHRLVKGRGKGQRQYPLLAVYHASQLANQKPGQVIADTLGLVMDSKGRLHPLLIEIKVTDRNPWYALVESLQQVKMARANERNLTTWLNKFVSPISSGAWGLVLAPRSYFRTDEMKDCKRLLAALKRGTGAQSATTARVALADSDLIGQGKMRILCDNWE